MSEQNYSWAALNGDFAFGSDGIQFKGGTLQYAEEPGPALGTALCNQSFGGGSISAEITFSNPSPRSACDLLLFTPPLVHSSALASATKFFTEFGTLTLGGHLIQRWATLIALKPIDLIASSVGSEVPSRTFL